MKASTRLEKAQILHEKIHNILLEHWDPIGVKGIPEARDEYNIYVSTIYKILIKRKPQNELFDYLWWAETEHMGLIGDQQRTSILVDQLINLMKG